MPRLFVDFFEHLYRMPLAAVIVWSTLENLIILVVVLVMGEFLVWRYGKHRVTESPVPLTWQEVVLAASCVVLNTLVTVVGVLLWQADIIRVRFDVNIFHILVDMVVLFMAMDLAMYTFHRIAHHPLLYPLIHRTHHLYENPRPLTLFVLNPAETLGFGILWLVVLVLYPAAWLSIIIFLTLNIVFGLVGHLGVEPMPDKWVHAPVIKYISTSTFHAEHHQDEHHNYGFYTLIWDRLFGTLTQTYTDDFQSARQGNPIDAR